MKNIPQLPHLISFRATRWMAAAASIGLFASPILAVDGTWNADSGSWGVAGNWASSIVAGGTSSIVNFKRPGGTNRTITLDDNRIVGVLNLGGPTFSTYTLSTGTAGGQLTFDNGASVAQLNFLGTNRKTIDAPVVLASSLDVTSSGGNGSNPWVINANISAAGGVDAAKVITYTAASLAGGQLQFHGNISDGVGNRKISFHQNVADGNMTLTGTNNTFSGGVRVSAGVLTLASGSQPVPGTVLGSGTLTLDGGLLSISNSNSTAFNNATKISGNADIITGSTGGAAKTNTFGALEMGGHVLTVRNTSSGADNSDDTLIFGATTLIGNATFSVLTEPTANNIAMRLILGSLNGAFNLTKTGSGILEFSAAAGTYSGTTTFNAGTMIVGHNTALGSGNVQMSGTSAATLQIGTGITTANNITYSNPNAASSIQRVVSGSSSFNVGTSGIFSSDLGGVDTAVAFRAASVPGTTTLMMAFASTSAASNDGTRVSDVFNLSLDITTDRTFVLQLDTAGSDPGAYLAWLDSGAWTLATDGNTGSGGLAGAYTTTWDAFLSNNGGTFDAATMLGAYGYDTASGQGWAVLNHASDYALVVPEPSTVVLCGLGLGFMLFRLRTTRRQLC